MEQATIVIEQNAAYHARREYINKSRLSKMSVCPRYFKWYEDNQQEPSADLIFGSAFHKLVLEQSTFDDEVAVMPTIDRRTKAGREMYQDFVEKNQGKYIITDEQYDTIRAMRDSINENVYARKLLRGNVEQSIYFADEPTGVLCKCRPDVWRKVVTEDGEIRYAIIDLKSCRSAVTSDFSRDVVKYGYDLQTYMCRLGLSLALNVPIDNIDFFFVAVEKTAPYLVNLQQADETVLKRGEAIFREYIGKYKYCIDTNNWYSYNGEHGIINTVGVPSWLTNTDTDNE